MLCTIAPTSQFPSTITFFNAVVNVQIVQFSYKTTADTPRPLLWDQGSKHGITSTNFTIIWLDIDLTKGDFKVRSG
jgi:hypothetical protein